MFSRETFEQFCSTIYFVGLKECYHTKHWPIRILWVFFFTLGFVLTAYFMYLVISDYKSNPTYTKVYFEQKDEYYFPEIYLMVEKSDLLQFYKDTNLSTDGQLYLTSLDMPVPQVSEEQYKSGKKDVTDYAKRFNTTTLNELYRRKVFADLTSLYSIECINCQSEFDSTKSEYFSKGLIKFNIQFAPIKSSLQQLKLIRRDSQRAIVVTPNISTDTDFNAGYLFSLIIGSKSSLPFTRYQTSVTFRTHQIFNIKAQRVKRYNMHNSCTEDLTKNSELCAFQCINMARANCGNCTVASDGEIDLVSPTVIPCSSLLFDVAQCIQKEGKSIDLCFSQCLPMCQEIIFEISVINKEGRLEMESSGKPAISFVLSYSDTGILTYEEMSSYNFQSAMSNVGGQLGLWLGTTLIIFVQAIMFWFNRCLDVRAQSKIKLFDLRLVQRECTQDTVSSVTKLDYF